MTPSRQPINTIGIVIYWPVGRLGRVSQTHPQPEAVVRLAVEAGTIVRINRTRLGRQDGGHVDDRFGTKYDHCTRERVRACN